MARKYAPRRGATPRRLKIEVGQRFGLWEVVGPGASRPPALHVYWKCRCACGTVRDHKATVLNRGRTVACGCQIGPSTKARATKHGKADTQIHRAWSHMRSRCENSSDKDFKNYGGRGIKVCERWQDFASFYADMGERPSPRHSLGRIDNDGNYEPNNVRWETTVEQANNRRNTRLVTHNGETLSLSQWGRRIGVSSGALAERIARGMTPELAVTLPRRDTRAQSTARGRHA